MSDLHPATLGVLRDSQSRSRHEADLYSISRTQRQGQRLLPRRGVFAAQMLEFLHHPDQHIRCLRESIPLSNADTRSSVERQVPPRVVESAFQPPLWNKVVCISSVEVFAPLHGVHVVPDNGALRHEDWRKTIATTADGKYSISKSDPLITRHHRVQSECYLGQRIP